MFAKCGAEFIDPIHVDIGPLLQTNNGVLLTRDFLVSRFGAIFLPCKWELYRLHHYEAAENSRLKRKDEGVCS